MARRLILTAALALALAPLAAAVLPASSTALRNPSATEHPNTPYFAFSLPHTGKYPTLTAGYQLRARLTCKIPTPDTLYGNPPPKISECHGQVSLEGSSQSVLYVCMAPNKPINIEVPVTGKYTPHTLATKGHDSLIVDAEAGAVGPYNEPPPFEKRIYVLAPHRHGRILPPPAHLPTGAWVMTREPTGQLSKTQGCPNEPHQATTPPVVEGPGVKNLPPGF